MSEVVLRATNLHKFYKVYKKPHQRFFDLFFKKKSYHKHQVLKGISFEIEKGNFVGVLGRNGAGKSTLLKILNEELRLSSGSFEANGSIALLQLGKGLNRELSGLENIDFSCQLMGYSEEDRKRITEEIVAFADIGKFIKYPIKTYSSGMVARLSFSIGININPDILIIDEVLSVGDMKFAQKCLRKLREFKDNGKTAIIVTHNIRHIEIFCDKAMWIHDGIIQEYGLAKDVAEAYRNYMAYNMLPNEKDKTKKIRANDDADVKKENNSIGTLKAQFIKFNFLNSNGEYTSSFTVGDSCTLALEIECIEEVPTPEVGWILTDKTGLTALHLNSSICDLNISRFEAGKTYEIHFKFKIPHIKSGEYIFAASIKDTSNYDEVIQRIHDAIIIRIETLNDSKEQFGYVQLTDFTASKKEKISAEEFCQ